MSLKLEELIPKLVEAVTLVMSPTTPQTQRHDAYQACEDFKENSPLCVQCGLVLASKQYDQFVRHFGLQLLEHSIKFRWNGMTGEDKLFIKENTMKLMAEGASSVNEEEAHIKDAMSRILVEMIKREWPQHWPQLLSELSQLANIGSAQTELVLLILRRLAEDVVTFQSLPTQRRREILTTLTREMSHIYNFFLDQLVRCFTAYTDLKSGGGSAQQVAEAGMLCCATLDTLAVYVDWIAMPHILERDSLLLQMLCSMLQHQHIQLPAAECLLIITNRKGKYEDRKPLMIMFSSDAMMAIFDAATSSAQKALEENHYLFLKRLCQVLVAMGMQLVTLWGPDKVERPDTFQVYLNVMLAFTSHASQVLSSYTLSLWSHFLRHPDIKTDPVLLSNIPQLIEIMARMLFRVGLPSSQDSHDSCAYASCDFDSDDDFNMFFSRLRADTAECIRYATLAAPVECFKAATTALQLQLSKPLDSGEGDSDVCKRGSPSFIEWDALSVFVECVMAKVTRLDSMQQYVGEGIQLLNNLLQYNTKDPLILSCVLSNISSLFPFITHQPNILPTVLDKIFSTAVFHLEGQTKATRSRAVRNVRRHACSILIKLSKDYPHLLLPGFEQLYQHIKSLSSDPEELSHLEKVTLMESLVLISNKFMDYEKQSAFVGEILDETKGLWVSEELRIAICSAQKFMAYVGLDQAPVEPSSADTCGINRSHLMQCVNVILAVMKRSEWPADPEDAKKGGFVMAGSNPPLLRNPAAKHLLSLLDHVFMLAKTLNEVYLPEHLNRRHADFVKAYDLTEVEKRTLLGITPPNVDNTLTVQSKQPVERMQAFLTNAFETSAHILGNTGLCFGHEFYQAPRLASFIINSYLTNLDAIPDYRLRNIIRAGLKPYAQCCPKEYYQSAVLPIVEVLGPYMLQRLNAKWQTLDQKVVDEDEEENPLSDEVIENHLVRLLSREYLEFLAILFRDKKGGSGTDNLQDDMTVDEDENNASATQGKDENISELGTIIFKADGAFPSLVMALFSALAWNDSTSCHKCSLLCWPVTRHLLAVGKLTAADACHLFRCVLAGMLCHGQHDATQAMLLTLALQLYENMRPVFPEVKNILLQVPSATEEAVKQFDEKLLTTIPTKQLQEKRKKELFKKLIQDMIGKNVGQQFKKEVHIKNLPPLIKASKPRPQPLEETEELGLCSLFDP